MRYGYIGLGHRWADSPTTMAGTSDIAGEIAVLAGPEFGVPLDLAAMTTQSFIRGRKTGAGARRPVTEVRGRVSMCGAESPFPGLSYFLDCLAR